MVGIMSSRKSRRRFDWIALCNQIYAKSSGLMYVQVSQTDVINQSKSIMIEIPEEMRLAAQTEQLLM